MVFVCITSASLAYSESMVLPITEISSINLNGHTVDIPVTGETILNLHEISLINRLGFGNPNLEGTIVYAMRIAVGAEIQGRCPGIPLRPIRYRLLYDRGKPYPMQL